MSDPDPQSSQPSDADGDLTVTRAGDRSGSDAGLSADLLAQLKIRIPGYQLLNVIGRGGQATVYKAIKLPSADDAADSVGQQIVAIKLLNSGPYADAPARERMRREVIAMKALLGMPNIVGVFDSGQTEDGRDYLVMNFVEGATLDEFWKHHPARSSLPDSTSTLLLLFKKICDAVGMAHMRGITHRDLSPSNIIVDEQGEPHILDFGLAKTAFDGLFASETNAVSLTGQFIGKLAYASPEQAKGNSNNIDIRTDVYALGVILYQIVTAGRFPYEVVGNLVDVLNNIIHTQPTPPSKIVDAGKTAIAQARRRIKSRHPATVNEVIEAIVLKALEKNPANRYQSATELARDIESYIAGQPTLASVHRSVNRSKLPASWRTVAAIATSAILVCLVALVAAAGHWKWGSRQRTQTTGPAPTAIMTSLPPVRLGANGERIVDLIPLIDLKRDAIRGPWEKRAEGLVRLPIDTDVDGLLRTPYQPPEEYDLRLQFTISGNVDDIKLDLVTPCKDSQCVVYSNQNRDNTSCGIGGRLDENATPIAGRVLYEVDKQNFMVVQVRATSVSAYLNEKLVAETRVDRASGSPPAPWDWIGNEKTIGLRYEHGSSITFHRIEVVEVSGMGRIVALAPLGTIPALPKAPPNETPTRVVDLMPLVDPDKDAVQGTWNRRNNELLSLGAAAARIRINYEPPEEYNLHTVFTRDSGPLPIGEILAHSGRSFFFSIGDSFNNLCSFKLGSGFDGYGNSPDDRANTPWSPAILTNRRKYSAVVYVRKGRVAVSMDGKLIIDFPTDYRNIDVPPHWAIAAGAMGLVADNAPTTFHVIEIEEITGKGHPTGDAHNPLTQTEKLPSTAPDSAANSQRTVDLLSLIDLKRDVERGIWEKHADGLARPWVPNDGLLRTPYQPPAEYDLTVEFTVPEPLEDFQFDLMTPCKGSPCVVTASQGAGNSKCRITGWADDNPTSADERFLFEGARRNLMLVQVRTDRVSAFLNGKLVAETRADQGSGPVLPPWQWIGKEGTIGLRFEHGSSILIHRMEVVEIKEAGRIVELTPLGTMPTLAKAPPSEKPIRVVDLMPLIDPDKDTVDGTWKRNGNELLTTAELVSRIRINYEPPEEYNFHVTFTRKIGFQSVGEVLSHAGRSFFFGMGESYNNLCAFKHGSGGPVEIGDYPDQRAGTAWTPGILTNGRKYSAVVYVRKGGVAVSMDGKLIIDFPTDYTNIDVPPHWDVAPAPMGLVAEWGEITFHTIEIEEITGKGHSTVDPTTRIAPIDKTSDLKHPNKGLAAR